MVKDAAMLEVADGSQSGHPLTNGAGYKVGEVAKTYEKQVRE